MSSGTFYRIEERFTRSGGDALCPDFDDSAGRIAGQAQVVQDSFAKYGMVRDGRALAAFERLSQTEGILPALESSHALAWVFDHPQELPAGGNVIVNLSGRGDKDMDIIKQYLGNKYHMPEESED